MTFADRESELPITEQENLNTASLSSEPTPEILRLINEEDKLVAPAVADVLPEIERAVEGIVKQINAGGRLFYIGAGTSGRLGVLDAAECPPTFGVSPDLVQAVIAGGYEATYRAVEVSEDDAQAGALDLQRRDFTANDALVGIAASGKTPYTVGAVKHARDCGAFTIALTCAPGSPITHAAEVVIAPVVGPEVIAGSTRLKSGTAQKLVLNMISTAVMVRLGYVTGNRMTNVQTRNLKLLDRATRIIMTETKLSQTDARAALESAGNDLRIALVKIKTGSSTADARTALEADGGVIEAAIRRLQSN
jgi:N-acetylmuramic acid 6-phosphate etherase